MKRTILFFLIIILTSATWAQDGKLQTKEPPSTIILPDIKLTIEDESEIPLFSNEKDLLSETSPEVKRIDIEELANTKVSEKIKLELLEDRKKEAFSLSTFKLYYGSFDNLIMDFNFGKSLGGLNYLITYLRNKRSSLSYQGTNYFNTDLALDDLNLDFIYGIGDESDLNATFGYYERSIGLHESTVNVNEKKLNIPAKIDFLYHGANNYKLSIGTYLNYLAMTHRTSTLELLDELWESGLNVKFDANWSQDNFFKAWGDFRFSSLLSNQTYEGGVNLIARFTLLKSIALELGGGMRAYSYDQLFFYPDLALIYKYSKILNLKVGVSGLQKTFNIEEILNHNQITLQQSDPEEKIEYRVSLNFSPVKFATLRASLGYQVYSSYLSLDYNSTQDLYEMNSISNVNVLESETILEFMLGERLALNMIYKYQIPDRDDLLFKARNTASVLLEFKHKEIGMEISSRLDYKDIEYITPGVYKPSVVLWDILFSQSVSPEILLDIKVNNILNQEDYEKINVPRGGVGVYGGIRILL